MLIQVVIPEAGRTALKNFIVRATTEAKSVFENDKSLMEYKPERAGGVMFYEGVSLKDALSDSSLSDRSMVRTFLTHGRHMNARYQQQQW